MMSTTTVLVAGSLDSWSSHAWRDGIQIQTLQRLDRILVRTRNSVYDLTVISPDTGDVLVRGGQFFPNATPARLAGSSLGNSFLKALGIYVGFQMELQHAGSTIFTTRVRSIVRSPLAANAPSSIM